MKAKLFFIKFFLPWSEAIRLMKASESRVTVFPSLEGCSVPIWRKPDRKKLQTIRRYSKCSCVVIVVIRRLSFTEQPSTENTHPPSFPSYSFSLQFHPDSTRKLLPAALWAQPRTRVEPY